ncbi:MAG: OmpA family protein, partial [Romboutsia sp.]|nr:OmpA family protein [Romboutsia sp.]
TTVAQKNKKNYSIDVAANPGSGAKESKESKEAKKYYNLEAKKYLKDWNLTLHFGTTTPFTDIRSYDWFRQFKAPSEVQWGAGVGLTKMMGNVFGINLDYTLGKLLGRTITRGGFAEDRTYWKTLGFDQEVYFKTELFHQGSINTYINWSNLIFGTNRWIKSNIKQKPWKERRVSLYTKMGVGFVRTESNIYNTADDLPITNSKYLRGFTNKFTEIIFPMALGLKFKVSKSFDIGLEGQFIFTNSDKLDAFNFSSAGGVQSLAKMNRDAYAYMNLNVTYKFGRIGAQKEHIEWVNPLEAYMSVVDEKLKNQYKVKDADGDGVIDELDEEPDTEEGAIVDTHGVTLDSDKDGYPDHKDPEPFSTPLLPIEKGINVRPDGLTPEQIQEVKNIVQNYINGPNNTSVTVDGWSLSMIFFDLDKYNIRTSEIPELYKVASVMKKFPDLKINVKGYTDVRNTDEYNMTLSENRVKSAIDYLVKTFNIDRNRFVP